MHEKTKALLEAVKEWRTTSAVLEVVGHWLDAGCPDLDAPEPDRLAELEARIKALGPVSALYERLTGLEEDMAGWEERLKALERPTAPPAPPPEPEFMPTTPGRYIRNPSSGFQTVDVWRGTDGVLRWGPMLRVDDPLTACWVGPAPATPPPEPARFVPTEPGWYWYQADGYAPYPRLYDDSVPQPSVEWLGPVAPYAPPNRTEPPSEQVRAQMLARARGCFDYSGGYRGDPKLLEAFHHGIQTVINALSDPDGSFQSRTLEAIGAEPPTRTEAEARAKPMRGDRWKGYRYSYTVVRVGVDVVDIVFSGGQQKATYQSHHIGTPNETYLGNFAHELEAL